MTSRADCQAHLTLIQPDADEPDETLVCEKTAGHQDFHGTLGGVSWWHTDLPQITTAEQLEALPRRTPVLDTLGSVWMYDGQVHDRAGAMLTKRWRSLNGNYQPSAVVVDRGPLTVVWQPQPGQEPTDA